MSTETYNGDEIYNKEYRRLRTLSSRTDIIAVSVSMPKIKQRSYQNYVYTNLLFVIIITY